MSVRMYMCDCLLGTANFRDKEDDENGHATTAHYELQRTRQSGQNRCELCEILQSPSTATDFAVTRDKRHGDASTRGTVFCPNKHVRTFRGANDRGMAEDCYTVCCWYCRQRLSRL